MWTSGGSCKTTEGDVESEGTFYIDDGCSVDYDGLKRSDIFKEYELSTTTSLGFDLMKKKAFFISILVFMYRLSTLA